MKVKPRLPQIHFPDNARLHTLALGFALLLLLAPNGEARADGGHGSHGGGHGSHATGHAGHGSSHMSHQNHGGVWHSGNRWSAGGALGMHEHSGSQVHDSITHSHGSFNHFHSGAHGLTSHDAFHDFGYHNPHPYLSFRYHVFGFGSYRYLTDCDLRWTRYADANCTRYTPSRIRTLSVPLLPSNAAPEALPHIGNHDPGANRRTR